MIIKQTYKTGFDKRKLGRVRLPEKIKKNNFYKQFSPDAQRCSTWLFLNLYILNVDITIYLYIYSLWIFCVSIFLFKFFYRGYFFIEYPIKK